MSPSHCSLLFLLVAAADMLPFCCDAPLFFNRMRLFRSKHKHIKPAKQDPQCEKTGILKGKSYERVVMCVNVSISGGRNCRQRKTVSDVISDGDERIKVMIISS